MKTFTVVTVSDINPLVSSNWVRIDDWRWVYAMLPLFLHLCVHDKERIMRQMYSNLAFSICSLIFRVCTLFIIPSNNLSHSKFSGNSKTQATDDGSWSKVSQLISVVTYALAAALVAVDKGSVGYPFVW
jgi:hypothetical protein